MERVTDKIVSNNPVSVFIISVVNTSMKHFKVVFLTLFTVVCVVSVTLNVAISNSVCR